MASDIQLATTLASPTGTGFLYKPYKLDGNNAVFKQSGASGQPSLVSFKRTEPKPTAVFPGVERMEVTKTEYFVVNSVTYVVTYKIVTSVPVPIALSDRTAVFTRGALLARDPTVQAAIESLTIPQ